MSIHRPPRHDSSGPISSPDEPGADRIKAALESLGDVDVEIGAIAELNQVTRGLTDPREYIEAAGPKVFMPPRQLPAAVR